MGGHDPSGARRVQRRSRSRLRRLDHTAIVLDEWRAPLQGATAPRGQELLRILYLFTEQPPEQQSSHHVAARRWLQSTIHVVRMEQLG